MVNGMCSSYDVSLPHQLNLKIVDIYELKYLLIRYIYDKGV